VGIIFWLGNKNLTIFRLKEQTFVKNKQDNQIQSITLCNMYFSKKLYAIYKGIWGKAPEAGVSSRIFVLRLLLIVSNT